MAMSLKPRCGRLLRSGETCQRQQGHSGNLHNSRSVEENRVLQRETKRALREKLNAIKLARGCIDCGYRAHPAALHFDHRPGVEKLGQVSDLMSKRGWDVTLAEVDKCDVRCANCHAVKTVERGQTGRVA